MDLKAIATPKLVNPRAVAQHDLFIALANACADRQASTEMIAGAAINLILTCVHRMHRTQGDAEQRWDDLMGQGKQALAERFRERRKIVRAGTGA